MKPTILAFLRSCAVGIENKASKESVVDFVTANLYPFEEGRPTYAWLERTVRKVIAATPEICSIQGGYFIPLDSTEARTSYDYHRKRGLAELTRAARIRDAHPGVEQGVLWS